MSYQLYYSPGACSMAVNVLLRELNQPFELTNANQPGTKNRTPEFLAVNPRGQVPILVVDGTPISEGGAILTYLCDTHPGALLPQSGIARAQALEGLMFCNSTLHPKYGPAFGALKTKSGAELDAALDQSGEAVQKLWDHVEEKLGKQKYLAGNQITVGDILMTVIANWNGVFGNRVKLGPNVTRVLSEVKSRPAFQQALESEGQTYKAAA